MAYRKRGVKTSPQLPTDRTSVRGSREKYFCPICDEVIVDAEGNKAGETLFTVMVAVLLGFTTDVRAGLSKVAFNCIRKSSNPFYCHNAD